MLKRFLYYIQKCAMKNPTCVAVIGICLHLLNKNRRRKRKIWTKEYRERYGHAPLIRTLRDQYPDDYRNYLRMDACTFNDLLSLVTPLLLKKSTNMREPITPESKLAATLRFLATGCSYEDLKFTSGISAPSLSSIVPETCRAICSVLKNYFKCPSTKEEWLNVATEFKTRWGFINCGGVMDGKHIRIVAPPNSGATFYNYKNFYSVVLLAVVNANYEFIFVDIGKNGRLSDGGVFEFTDFYHKLKTDQLNLPDNSETTNNLNFVFLGDEAFALDKHVLKPYPQRDMDNQKQNFNYRLCRARNVVENTFGIISSRFRILQRPINLKHKSLCLVVLAVCFLHNFLRRRSQGYFVARDSDGAAIQAAPPLTGLQSVIQHSMSVEARQNRNAYKDFFNSEEGRHIGDAFI